MFGALNSVLTSAASTLAPDVPLSHQFRHHWTQFVRYYSERKLKRNVPVEQTNQVLHLQAMAKLLQQESHQEEDLGGCLEYLVHHQLLDVLSTLFQADVPVGIRSHVLAFFVFLLTHVKHSFLAYTSVYLPLRRLLGLFAASKASPTEDKELAFILALVKHLRQRPDLLALFAHRPEKQDISHSGHSSRTSSMIDLCHHLEQADSSSGYSSSASNRLEDESSHVVVTALLSYIDSADYIVACQAMDALLNVSAFDDLAAADNAVQGTALCSQLSDRLSSLFVALPTEKLEPGHVEDVKVTWMHAHHLHKKDEEGDRPELISFFSWLDYVDDVCDKAHCRISRALASEIRAHLFTGQLEQQLLLLSADDQEKKRPLALALVTQCWIHITSEALVMEFAGWLLEEDRVQQSVMQMCLSDHTNVAVEALRLLDQLLETPCEPILQNLVLAHLANRGYMERNKVLDEAASWSDEEDIRERRKVPNNIGRVLNAWLYVVPDELRSCDGSVGYEQYVKTAQSQLIVVGKQCEGFSWPSIALFLNDDDDEEEDVFEEGPFLSALLDLVASMFDRDYAVNLQATALLSKLAHLPHPYVHEFLLDPLMPLRPGKISLFSVLQQVLKTGSEKASQIEKLERKIISCKRALLGTSDGIKLAMGDQEIKSINAFIVLEEFCKELAAIVFAKFQLESN